MSLLLVKGGGCRRRGGLRLARAEVCAHETGPGVCGAPLGPPWARNALSAAYRRRNTLNVIWSCYKAPRLDRYVIRDPARAKAAELVPDVAAKERKARLQNKK